MRRTLDHGAARLASELTRMSASEQWRSGLRLEA